MICVTGVGGTVSGGVIRQLDSSKTPFRGAYFSNKKAEGMPEAISDRMLALEHYFREGRRNRIIDDIKPVTERASRRLAEYVRETAATGVWDMEREEVTR